MSAFRDGIAKPGVPEHPDAHILVVDDERLFAMALKHLLASAGYQHVQVETDSTAVLDVCHGFKPELVLLDLCMPHHDGIDVLHDLRNCAVPSYNCSIVIVSGLESSETRREVFQAGADDYISKPVEPMETLFRVSRQLRYHYAASCMDAMVRKKTAELVQTRIEVVERLAIAIELRDGYTAMHANRLPELAALLGEMIGLAQEEVSLIRQAAPLHDIGKLAIPDAILLKPSTLTAEEFEVVKTHTLLGARLLAQSDSPLLQVAEAIALYHHEHWDGTGYPQGIAHEAIPIGARIVALADVFDALTHERPYKKAWPLERSIQEIRKGRNTHFDPQIVEAFLELYAEHRLNAELLDSECHWLPTAIAPPEWRKHHQMQ